MGKLSEKIMLLCSLKNKTTKQKKKTKKQKKKQKNKTTKTKNKKKTKATRHLKLEISNYYIQL